MKPCSQGPVIGPYPVDFYLKYKNIMCALLCVNAHAFVWKWEMNHEQEVC
jgi:hypothetical protein